MDSHCRLFEFDSEADSDRNKREEIKDMTKNNKSSFNILKLKISANSHGLPRNASSIYFYNIIQYFRLLQPLIFICRNSKCTKKAATK